VRRMRWLAGSWPGRVLIHIVLRRRELALRALPPISPILATRSDDYVRLLDARRYDGPPAGEQASAARNEWIGFFAGACRRAVSDAEAPEQELSDLIAKWEALVQPARADSAVRALVAALLGVPVLTVPTAAATIGRSFAATNNAIQRLVEVGILRQISIGKRNRAFEAGEVIERFTALERWLASPAGDTRIDKPARPVPYRR
jgi:Fic family protein